LNWVLNLTLALSASILYSGLFEGEKKKIVLDIKALVSPTPLFIFSLTIFSFPDCNQSVHEDIMDSSPNYLVGWFQFLLWFEDFIFIPNDFLPCHSIVDHISWVNELTIRPEIASMNHLDKI